MDMRRILIFKSFQSFHASDSETPARPHLFFPCDQLFYGNIVFGILFLDTCRKFPKGVRNG